MREKRWSRTEGERRHPKIDPTSSTLAHFRNSTTDSVYLASLMAVLLGLSSFSSTPWSAVRGVGPLPLGPERRTDHCVTAQQFVETACDGFGCFPEAFSDRGRVCVCYQLYLSCCIWLEWVMAAAGFLCVAVFASPSDNTSQSHAIPCRHSRPISDRGLVVGFRRPLFRSKIQPLVAVPDALCSGKAALSVLQVVTKTSTVSFPVIPPAEP